MRGSRKRLRTVTRRSEMSGIGMIVRGAIGGTLATRGGRPRAFDFIATGLPFVNSRRS
jgi:hypothetical protein